VTLNNAQLELLFAPLSPGRVRSLSGNSHLEAWDVRRWLLRIFGYGGFDIETLECAVVSERSVWNEQNPLNGRHTVVYRVQVRLTVRDPDGHVLAFFDDGATGDGINQPSLQKAHDFALKTAMSQALKRAAVNLGDQFGLSLYDKGRSGETTVGRSVAHGIETSHAVREDVAGGELDEAREPEPTATVNGPDSPPAEPDASPRNDAAGSASPSDSLPEGEATAEVIAAQVAHIRDAAVALLTGTKRNEALQKLTRLQLDAGKAHLMNEPTVSPKGVEMTLQVLLNEVLSALSRSTG
jgi:hypothetical protein